MGEDQTVKLLLVGETPFISLKNVKAFLIFFCQSN